jgi:hypothetical protein
MEVDETPGLLRSVFGFLARKPPDRPIKKPKSLRARRRDTWLQMEAFMQHDADAFDEMSPEQRKRTLHALEDYVEINPDGEADVVRAPEMICGRLHHFTPSLFHFAPADMRLPSRTSCRRGRFRSFRYCATWSTVRIPIEDFRFALVKEVDKRTN